MDFMTETHRHLFQFMLNELYCEKKVLADKFKECTEKYKFFTVQEQLKNNDQPFCRDTTLDEFIETINSAISSLHLNIKSIRHPKTKRFYYGLVNEQGDEIAKQATKLNAREIELFRKMLGLIISSENEVSATDLLNERDSKISLAEANTLLIRLENEGWLERTTEGFWFGPRVLLDLREYMTEQFGYDPLS